MKLIKRNPQTIDPFTILDQLKRDLYPAFNNLDERYEGWGSDFKPSMDVHEEKDAFVVTAELAGVNKDDVKVTIEDKTLSIRGEKKQEKKSEDQKQHFSERFYGTFVRNLEFPVEIDAEKIKASYKDGILELTVPKSKTAVPKQISIDVK